MVNLLEAGRISDDEPIEEDVLVFGDLSIAPPDGQLEHGFWVGQFDKDIVGMLGVRQTSADKAEIRRLRVHPEFRRLGIGRCLMEHAIRHCQRRGYLKVGLDVRTERGPAIALFEKCGFQVASTRKINGGERLDFYLDLYREPNH